MEHSGKESFYKVVPLSQDKTINTIKEVSKDNSVKEVIISIGQEISCMLLE